MSTLYALEAERPDWLSFDLFPFTSRFVDIDGHHVHYVDEGHGPVLLFLPGAPNWSFFYRHFVASLRTDFRCIAIDYPGFGPSSAAPDWTPTVPALSRVVERFIETLGLERVILVAGDAGGPIGLGVAARHPAWFAGLVLAGTFGWPLTDYARVRRMLRLSGGPLVRLLQERFNLLLKLTARSFPMSAAERAVYLAPYATPAARRAPVVLLGDLAGNDAAMGEIEQALQTRLQRLPVLLLWGDKDPVYEFLPRFQRLLPQAESLVIPGAHHFPFADAPQPMIAAIRRWWQTASSSTSSTPTPTARRVS